MPASISSDPAGVRTTVQFPADPLANTQTSRDILVSRTARLNDDGPSRTSEGAIPCITGL
jgi:hypothetical protein